MVAKVPEVNMYTTTPAITAMAIRIKVAKIGDIPLRFILKFFIFVFFASVWVLRLLELHSGRGFINYEAVSATL